MVNQASPECEPTYLFLRERVNRFGRLPYSAASLHGRLSALTQRLQLTDSLGRPVRISKTHRFRHTRATNLEPRHAPGGHRRSAGHRTLRMTIRYARIANKTVADKYHAVSEKVEALYAAPAAVDAEVEGPAMRRVRADHRHAGQPLVHPAGGVGLLVRDDLRGVWVLRHTVEFKPTLQRLGGVEVGPALLVVGGGVVGLVS